MFGAPPRAQTGRRGASRLRRDAPKAGGFGGPCSGPPPRAQTGRRGASRLRRDAPKAGGFGGPSRGPPFRMTPMSALDFVAIGHVTLDRFGDEVRPGGAALYAAVTADRLGLSAGILTSHADDFPLDLVPPGIEVVSVPAPATTMFEHAWTDGDRALRVLSAAAPLGEADVPEDWRDAGLVLLAPVMNEVDARLAAAFADASVAAEAQGWLRGLARHGAVRTVRWEAATRALRTLQTLFLSASDVRGQESAMTEWVQRVPIAVVTAGSLGALR